MKKIFAIAAFAAALLASASCNKEQNNSIATTTKTLSLGFEQRLSDEAALPESKTYVRNFNDGTIWWSTNGVDKILYAFDASGNKYNFVSAATATEATREFSCDTWPVDAEMSFAVWSGKLATGSAADATNVSGNIISGLNLPSTQTINNANSFAGNANIAVMKAGDTALRNAFGYIRYTLPAVDGYAGVKTVSVSADENLAGDVQIDYSGSAPAASIVSGGVKSVSANTRFKDGYQAGTYFLIVPPGTYHNVKITITPFAEGADVTDQNAATGTPFTLTAKADVVVERSKYTDAGSLPNVDPNAGSGGDDDDDIEWGNEEGAFDYNLAKGTTRTAKFIASELAEYGVSNPGSRELALGKSATTDDITYYGKLFFYGNRLTTDSKPGPLTWDETYPNVIPTSSAFSWKINRPGKLQYFLCVGDAKTIERGVTYYLAIFKTQAGEDSAEIIATYTPEAAELTLDRDYSLIADHHLEFEVTKEMLLGIDEPATLYFWGAHKLGTMNVQLHHFPIKWTPTANLPE
jgi:hypothetical protein